jgi:hypothetical protein
MTLAFNAGFDAGQQAKEEWINVNKETPDDKEYVIGCNFNDNWCSMIYFDGIDWYNSDDLKGLFAVIPTHWMPKPKLPTNPPKE